MFAACALSACSASTTSAGKQTVTSHLWDVANEAAHDARGELVTAMAVRTTDEKAIRYVTGRQPDAEDVRRTAVWLVLITSNQPFACSECSVEPKADGTVDGRYMFFLVTPQTYKWGAWEDYRSEPLDLAPLGRAIQLHG
jgi:hypothetical protein